MSESEQSLHKVLVDLQEEVYALRDCETQLRLSQQNQGSSLLPLVDKQVQIVSELNSELSQLQEVLRLVRAELQSATNQLNRTKEEVQIAHKHIDEIHQLLGDAHRQLHETQLKYSEQKKKTRTLDQRAKQWQLHLKKVTQLVEAWNQRPWFKKAFSRIKIAKPKF